MRPCYLLILLNLTASTLAVDTTRVNYYIPSCACRVLKVLDHAKDHAVQDLIANLTLTSDDQARCDHWTPPPGYLIQRLVDSNGQPTTDLGITAGVGTEDTYFICGPSQLKQVCADFK